MDDDVRTMGEEGTPEERQRQRQEREELRQYLRGYLVASKRVADLRERLRVIREDYSALTASKISAVVARAGISDPTPSKTLLADDAEARLMTALDEARAALLEREEIISLLPATSVERRVIELKYIDGKEEWDIGGSIGRSGSVVRDIERSGLDILLTYPSVRRRIKEEER